MPSGARLDARSGAMGEFRPLPAFKRNYPNFACLSIGSVTSLIQDIESYAAAFIGIGLKGVVVRIDSVRLMLRLWSATHAIAAVEKAGFPFERSVMPTSVLEGADRRSRADAQLVRDSSPGDVLSA